MDLMINKVRIKASQTGLAEVPVVLENHTKSIRDFNSMDRFFEKLAASPDIEFLTLSQLNDALTQKRFPVRMG